MPAVAILVGTVAAALALTMSGPAANDVDFGVPGPLPPPRAGLGQPPSDEAIAAAQTDARAYPRGYVSPARTRAARKASENLSARLTRRDFRPGFRDTARESGLASSWTSLGPDVGVVPAEVFYTGRETTVSGRTTSMVIDPTCVPGDCRLWIAASGGGLWRTGDALAETPDWTPLSDGLTTSGFGALALDPNDPTGNTIYAGSGDPTGWADSEPGVGLFKSIDGGDSWTLLPGSHSVAKGRSISSVYVDPNDSKVIWFGTTIGRQGASSVANGRRTPPNAPPMGIYRSTDGGDYFTLQFSKPGDGRNPATGTDYYTGGVRRLIPDPNDPQQLYATIMGYGIFRTGNPLDGPKGTWHQVYRGRWAIDNFESNPVDPHGSMTDFDLANVAGQTRVYVGDTTDQYNPAAHLPQAILLVAENISGQSAEDLLAAEAAHGPEWEVRSNPDIHASIQGYSSYKWCQDSMCANDSFVKVDPSDPDTVWLGGAMNLGELNTTRLSNGRSLVRSTNAGVSFTDMTQDLQDPAMGVHFSQFALVFNPANTDQVFVSSDGGIVRTDGVYADDSADCGTRGLSGDDLAFCQMVLSAIPSRIDSLNRGLDTLIMLGVGANPAQPYSDLLAGADTNGVWAGDGAGNWFETVAGYGGPAAFSPEAGSRIMTYYAMSGAVSFAGSAPTDWNYVTAPMVASSENFSLFPPLISDPAVAGTYFTGGESIWRTQDSGGDQVELETKCNLYTGSGPMDECGDWETIGPKLSPNPLDIIVAVGRSRADTSTLWAGLRYGGLFVSENADAVPSEAAFHRVDTADMPQRFITGIAVDPADANHAWISYSSYSAYTPTTPGHVFEARYDPETNTAAFTDRSYDLGDQPVTGLVLDSLTGDLYASTDFGVARLPAGATSWTVSAPGLGPVAVTGVTLESQPRVLYAATRGRGVDQLALDPVADLSGPSAGEVGTPLSFSSAGSAGFKSTSVQWSFPDGTQSAAADAGYTPTSAGAQTVRLTVTDALGHSTVTERTVTVAAKPDPAEPLVPTFGSGTATADGFRVQITNYNPAFTWTANASSGKGQIGPDGVLTVTGAKPSTSITVTVTTSRTGYPEGAATVTGRSMKQCALNVTAKKASKRLPKTGSLQVVKKASSGGSCSVGSPKVQTVLLGRGGTADVQVTRNASKRAVKVTTHKTRVQVTVTLKATSSKSSVTSKSWTRTWRTK